MNVHLSEHHTINKQTVVSLVKNNTRSFFPRDRQVLVLNRHCAGGGVSSICPPVQVG